MKKEYLLIIGLTVIIIVLLAILAFWPGKSVPNQQINLQKTDGIEIFSPIANTEITSPLKITGVVSGNSWTGFEGQVGTVELKDYKGNVLVQTYLPATTEWTQLPTSFEVNLNFVPKNSGPATLIFKNENASGDPVRDKTFSLPVKLTAVETMSVKAFFAKNEITGSTCSLVFPVERVVAKTEAVARTALEELLKGPTAQEKEQGYYSSINSGVKINSLSIDENGTARVDFSQEMETTGGSCRVTEIRSEISYTLKQFPTVKNVVISIDGRTEDILQP